MTLFTGIIDFENLVDDAACLKLRASLSRNKSETYQEFRLPNVYIVKVDIGALTPAPPIINERGATFLCGDPLLDDEEDWDRCSQAERIHTNIFSDATSALSTATGSFCGAHCDGNGTTCILFTDKLAIRPVYYIRQNRRLIFASALRILLNSRLSVHLTVDPIGFSEQLTQGFSLGTRTQYNEVACLGAGEAIVFSRNSETSVSYWQWSALEPEPLDLRQSAELCLSAFRSAVRRRLRKDHCVQSFLSGGLDSRLIATVLREEGANLHTFNFSRGETADKLIANEFSRVVRSRHHEGNLPTERMIAQKGDIFSLYLASYVGDGECYEGNPPDRPRVVWSGDGGSVCLGHVYMTQEMVDVFHNSAPDVVTRLPSLVGSFPKRIFKGNHRKSLTDSNFGGIISELTSLDSINKDRRLYFYLLFNDQRRHLYQHFEEIDLHRMEVETPFFDSGFISAVAQTPISFGLRHVLYHEMLSLLPDWCREVAWQTYPGHLTCPLPLPAGAEYQWGEKSATYKVQSHAYWTRAALRLTFGQLPYGLRRSVILLYCLRHIFLRQNCGYVFKAAADVVETFAAASSGPR